MRANFKDSRLWLAVSLFAVVIFAANAEAQLKRVNMAISALSAGYAGLYIAKDLGLFEKNGLDVELILISSGPIVHGIISGDLHMAGVGASRVVASNLEGSGVLLLAETNNRQPYKLIVPANIKNPSQLIGKKVGVTQFGGLDDTAMRYALTQLGVNPNKDVTILAVGGKSTRFSALTQGAIAATVLDPPYTLDAKKLGLNFLFDFLKSSQTTVYGTIAAKDSYIKQNRDTIRALLKSYITAVQFYRSNKPESIKILAKYMRISLPGKAEEMEETYDAFVKTASCKPYVDPAGVAELLKDIGDKNPKAKAANPQNFIDMSFIRELEDTGFIESVCK